jgi:hypothetical protein
MRLLALTLWLWQAAPPPAPVKPVYDYAPGKPVRLEAACANAELDEFGLDCTADEPCPVYLEITAVETAGQRLFAAGNLHTGKVTLSAVLLMSENDGTTWTEPHPRLKAANLDLIQFFDHETGWISGHHTGPLLRDPFFLKTADAGKSWRRFGVFEDQEVGVVDSFWFDSRTSGVMVLDRLQAGQRGRWQRWESMTGGESWMLREVSPKPIPPLRPKSNVPNADWRLRPDPAAKTVRLERRAEGRWSAVSTFAVGAGECKPAPPAPPPQEPPPPQ